MAQLGSASALGAEGRQFESGFPDHGHHTGDQAPPSSTAPPARPGTTSTTPTSSATSRGSSSIGRAPAFQAGRCEFKSRLPLSPLTLGPPAAGAAAGRPGESPTFWSRLTVGGFGIGTGSRGEWRKQRTPLRRLASPGEMRVQVPPRHAQPGTSSTARCRQGLPHPNRGGGSRRAALAHPAERLSCKQGVAGSRPAGGPTTPTRVIKSPSSSGPGPRPFTAATPVRIRLGVPRPAQRMRPPALVVESVDTAVSKTAAGNGVRVQVPPWARPLGQAADDMTFFRPEA